MDRYSQSGDNNMPRKVSERKIPFNCYLTLSQLEALEMLADVEGKPKAELVREAITEYLAQRKWENDHQYCLWFQNKLD